jgi:hypothetical protein
MGCRCCPIRREDAMSRATTRIAAAVAVLCVTVALAGCGGNEVVRPTVNVSVGQQLIDLKKARDSGALTEKEYQSQKSKLIKSVE